MRSLQSSDGSLPAWALRLLERLGSNRKTPLDNLLLNPGLVLKLAGFTPDPWQKGVLESAAQRIMMLCSRQVGKSSIAAALALETAILEAPALVLIISPSERQSGELVQKVKTLYSALRRPRKLAGPVRPVGKVAAEGAALDAAWAALPEKERESALQLHLKNGSRIIGLPGKASTVVGYSGVTLLLIDEAARVGDELYRSVRPMLAASRGRLVALSTPFGKRGWFFEEWESANAWHRVRVKASECPRIPAAFLEEERRSLGERWYAQEYETNFSDAIDAVFGASVIEAAMSEDVQPW